MGPGIAGRDEVGQKSERRCPGTFLHTYDVGGPRYGIYPHAATRPPTPTRPWPWCPFSASAPIPIRPHSHSITIKPPP